MNIVNNRIRKNSKGCWEWIASLNSSGYGQLVVNGRYWLAHRYTFNAKHGNLLHNELVRHLCHNRKCCNPDHLERGSHIDNYNDSRELYSKVASKRRLVWNVYGKKYGTIREASSSTGISQDALLKYTNRKTRVFDSKSYERAKKIAGW